MFNFNEVFTAVILEVLFLNDSVDSRINRESWFNCHMEVLVNRCLPRAFAHLPF
jgi:hypothetical protein